MSSLTSAFIAVLGGIVWAVLVYIIMWVLTHDDC